jgi:transposase-like protein
MSVQVYGDNAVTKTAVYKWVTCFSEGRESVTDEESSGRPATTRTDDNIPKVRKIVRENPVRSTGEQENIDRETGKSKLKILT